MATNTTNYNLTKPEPTDFYDIDVTNANLDKIDTAIKTVENGVNAKTQVATMAEAQAGTDNTKIMTPLRTNEAITNKAVLKNTPDNSNTTYGYGGTVTRIIKGIEIPGDGYYGNISIFLPKIDFSGVIDVKVQSQFRNINAGGGARVVYQFGASNGAIYTNQKQVLEVSSFFAAQYTFSGLFDSGANYIFALEKLNQQGNNAIRIEITFSGTGSVHAFANGTTFQSVVSNSPTNTPALVGINQEIENLKSSVSNGKAQVAAAITGKGISTAADASFATLASNIGQINTNTSATGTVVSSSTSMNFELINNTQASSPYVEVTGLGFRPSSIQIFSDGGSGTGSVNTVVGNYNFNVKDGEIDNGFFVGQFTYATNSSNVNHSFRIGVGNAYVNETGFRLPALLTGRNFTYYAIK